MDPFIGEIRMLGFNFAPQGWAFCDGQLVPISQNEALFALLGTQFGGDGYSYFNLPDLRGRIPVHRGAGMGLRPKDMGESGGLEAATLTESQLPSHRHARLASLNGAGTADPAGAVPALAAANVYGPANNLVPMAEAAAETTGMGEAHENLPPFTVVNFCIAVYGIWPSRS